MLVLTTHPHPRATRAAGQQTRRALLDAAAPLFTQRGLAGVSQADIAQAAGTFPSQVTYYFGSKEALFVEAACRGVLHAATEVERAGERTRTPHTYVRAMVHTALRSPALLTFVEAALLVRRRDDLAPRVRETFAPAQSARACRRARTPVISAPCTPSQAANAIGPCTSRRRGPIAAIAEPRPIIAMMPLSL